MTDTDAEALWGDRLAEGRFRLSNGLDAERLARRYDVETSEAIAELTNRATLELLNSEYRTLSLEEFDAAAKRMDVEIREVMTDGGTSPSGTERDHIYVGRIPGLWKWSTDYEEIAEWAGGEENVSIMHNRAHIGYVADLSEHPEAIENQWCSVNHRYECGHFAYGPPRLLPLECPECHPAFAEQLRSLQAEDDRNEA